MKEYTKTITVQAVQWTGENLKEIEAMHEHTYHKTLYGKDAAEGWAKKWAETLPFGYWLAIDSNGHDFHIMPRAFHRDYKEVTE